MPERATISSLITKAQTVTVSIVGSSVLAELVTTETQVSILQTSITIPCKLALPDTPFRRHFVLGKLFWKITTGFSVPEASLIRCRQELEEINDCVFVFFPVSQS